MNSTVIYCDKVKKTSINEDICHVYRMKDSIFCDVKVNSCHIDLDIQWKPKYNFFCGNQQANFKILWKFKRPRLSQAIMKMLDDLYYLTIRFTVKLQQSKWCDNWHKYQHIYWWNRIKSSMVDLWLYNHWIPDKSIKAKIQWEKSFNKWLLFLKWIKFVF